MANEYRRFVAEHRRAGKSLKEIGPMWQAHKGGGQPVPLSPLGKDSAKSVAKPVRKPKSSKVLEEDLGLPQGLARDQALQPKGNIMVPEVKGPTPAQVEKVVAKTLRPKRVPKSIHPEHIKQISVFDKTPIVISSGNSTVTETPPGNAPNQYAGQNAVEVPKLHKPRKSAKKMQIHV